MRCKKEQIVIIFDEVIYGHLKAKKQFDSRNRPQVVRPRLTEILQKLINKIQGDRIIVKLYEFSVGLK